MRHCRTLPSRVRLPVVIPNPLAQGLAGTPRKHICWKMADFPKAPPEKNETRYIACQMAVETVLQDLVEDAVRRGWEETEVLSAVTEVADNLMLAAAVNRDLDLLLAALRRKMPPPILPARRLQHRANISLPRLQGREVP